MKLKPWHFVCIILILAAVIIVSVNRTNKDNSGLPSYAVKDERTKEAYLFAKENPEALDGVNCYCGCMQHLHDGRLHSKGLHDCFLNSNSADGFEMHGSQCNMCINDALEVKRMTNMNITKEDIKKYIDSKYGK